MYQDFQAATLIPFLNSDGPHTFTQYLLALFSFVTFQTTSQTFPKDKKKYRGQGQKRLWNMTRSQSIAMDISTSSLYYLYMLMNFPGSGNKHPGGEFNEDVSSLSNRGLKSK